MLKWLAASTVLAVCTAFGSTVAADDSVAAEAPNCKLHQYASLNLTRTATGDFLVPVKIQTEEVLLKLDTTFSTSAIWASTAQRMGLSRKDLSRGIQVHVGRALVSESAVVKDIGMGLIHFQQTQMLVVPVAGVTTNGGREIAGILGMDWFANFDVEFDLAHDKLRVFSTKHCPGKVVYWAKDFAAVPIRFDGPGEIYFPMELQGKKIATTLASASDTTLSTVLSKGVYGIDRHSAGVQMETDESSSGVHYVRLMDLATDGIKIIDARVRLLDPFIPGCGFAWRDAVADYDKDCGGGHPLQLGRDILTSLRIYLATKEQMLYLTSSDAGI